jgi:hypothetical protein
MVLTDGGFSGHCCQPSELSTQRDIVEVIGAGEKLAGSEAALRCVSFGVTWGKPAFASASFLDCTASEAERLIANTKREAISAADVKPDTPNAADGLRGRFVEMAISAEGGGAPKPLKKMVGTTGIEPVTPTMSR